MKPPVIFLLLFIIHANSSAQDASVEKSIFGIQTGFLGVWGHNEARISNQIALRSELGLDIGFSASKRFPGMTSYFLMVPVGTLEPRWYYNLNKRLTKSRTITGNSGNFIALNMTYYPAWVIFSNPKNLTVSSSIQFVPTWGIRRSIGKHFVYEAGFGIGYRRFLNSGSEFVYEEPVGNLHLRIGYRL
ncbi:MAG: hypothetical protein JJU28_03920 [Cyclobacteriaceae bacterium]|nr:hypothetical protein [Cyclobacteriaceae bacterium]